VLFERMVAAGLPREVGPIAVMLAEHEQGRAFTRGMRAAAERLAAGDAAAARDVVANARGYAALLRQHIQKEDGILLIPRISVIPFALAFLLAARRMTLHAVGEIPDPLFEVLAFDPGRRMLVAAIAGVGLEPVGVARLA